MLEKTVKKIINWALKQDKREYIASSSTSIKQDSALQIMQAIESSRQQEEIKEKDSQSNNPIKEVDSKLAPSLLEKISNDNKSEQEETSADEEVELPVNLDYSFHEEKFIASLYNKPVLDYTKMFYGDEKRTKVSSGSQYEYNASAETIAYDAENIMTDETAQKTIVEIQYAAVLGDSSSITENEREKLDLWIKFNPAMFNFYQKAFSITNNVNYGKLF